MVALPEIESALALLERLRSAAGDRMTSLEIMSRGQIEVITENLPDVPVPFALDSLWYLLIELTVTLAATDLRAPLEAVLGDAFESGLVADAVLAGSEAQAAALWRIRHSVSEGSKRAGYVVSHDSAVPLERQAAFARNVERRILDAVPEARVVMHGHIGDGNIHVLAILDGARYPGAEAAAPLVQRINAVVDHETAAQGGAISAEHGIGISNRDRLEQVADPADLALMRRVKALLDPGGIMNPGKVFSPRPADPPQPSDRPAAPRLC